MVTSRPQTLIFSDPIDGGLGLTVTRGSAGGVWDGVGAGCGSGDGWDWPVSTGRDGAGLDGEGTGIGTLT